MKTRYAFENLLRTPYELLVGIIALLFGYMLIMCHSLFALDIHFSFMTAIPFLLLGGIRIVQGVKIVKYRKRLLTLKSFSMGTTDVPLSPQNLYLGQGFQWMPHHRQRLHLLSSIANQAFMQKGHIYRYIQSQVKKQLDIGGKPWIHGVGADKEKEVCLAQHNRTRHICVFGMTQVGKTRLSSILMNQDIRNGEAVLIIDPKGDLGLMQDIYCAAVSAGRKDALKMIHFGFPKLSVRYNPLASFTDISEVADRITGAISGDGEGQQFKDFAWQYVNIAARCLYELGEVINYKTIAFCVKNPQALLTLYADKKFPKDYKEKIQETLDEGEFKMDKMGNELSSIKCSEAVKLFIEQSIEEREAVHQESFLDNNILPLYNAVTLDQSYYDKITASVGPVLDKINQTHATSIFSFDNKNKGKSDAKRNVKRDAKNNNQSDGKSTQDSQLPIISLENAIKDKNIVYIGLDSLSNRQVAEGVGQAVIADLVSLCGRLYKTTADKKASLCLHCDEFSNIVRDEFINLLNKAGGAGVKVTAYTQTINDLGAAFGGNRDKAQMLVGNFGTTICLLVENEDTARAFTDCLEHVRARSSVPSTMSNDKSDHNEGALFTSYNTDTVTEDKVLLVEVNDIFSLPKGQAFVRTDGGKVYKIRIPLPKNDGSAPKDFESMLKAVNLQ